MKEVPEKYEAISCSRCSGEGFTREYSGDYVRFKREADNMALREAARQLKISAAFLSDMELGRRKVNKKVVDFVESL